MFPFSGSIFCKDEEKMSNKLLVFSLIREKCANYVVFTTKMQLALIKSFE